MNELVDALRHLKDSVELRGRFGPGEILDIDDDGLLDYFGMNARSGDERREDEAAWGDDFHSDSFSW